MRLDNELGKIFARKLKEVNLLDESRSEPYEDGTYSWDKFLTDADYEAIEKAIETAQETSKDYKFEDTQEELEFISTEVTGLLQKNFVVIELPYIEPHVIME